MLDIFVIESDKLNGDGYSVPAVFQRVTKPGSARYAVLTQPVHALA